MTAAPRITIVTPSYNQGRFIERTLTSVLEQGYPDLELIVIDGGSTDETVSVLERFGPAISYWCSEPDRGQTHAINKGFARSTGTVLGWLNSDDYLLPGSLNTIGRALSDGSGASAIVGHCQVDYVERGRSTILRSSYQDRDRLLAYWRGYEMHQPAIYWRREVMETVGLLDERLHFGMDFDYWARIAEHFDFRVVDQVLAGSQYHRDAKTGDSYRRWYREIRPLARQYRGLRPTHPAYWGHEGMAVAHWCFREVRQGLARIRPGLHR
jgi:glycosyltransferase involved in cell wall biosynthesis